MFRATKSKSRGTSRILTTTRTGSEADDDDDSDDKHNSLVEVGASSATGKDSTKGDDDISKGDGREKHGSGTRNVSFKKRSKKFSSTLSSSNRRRSKKSFADDEGNSSNEDTDDLTGIKGDADDDNPNVKDNVEKPKQKDIDDKPHLDEDESKNGEKDDDGDGSSIRKSSKRDKSNRKEKKRKKDRKERKKERKKERGEDYQSSLKQVSRKRPRLGVGFGAASIDFQNDDDSDDLESRNNAKRLGPAFSLARGEEREDMNGINDDEAQQQEHESRYRRDDMRGDEERTGLYSKEALAKLKRAQNTYQVSQGLSSSMETDKNAADGEQGKNKANGSSPVDADALAKKKSVNEQLDEILDRKDREKKIQLGQSEDSQSTDNKRDSKESEFEREDDFISFMNKNSSSHFLDRSKKKGSSLLEKIVAGDEALSLAERHERKRRNKFTPVPNDNGASSFIAGLRDPQEDIDVYAASADDGILLETGGEGSDMVLDNDDDWGEQAAARGNWMTKGEIERRKTSRSQSAHPFSNPGLMTGDAPETFDFAPAQQQMPSLAQLKQSLSDALEKLTSKYNNDQKHLDRKQSECSMLRKSIEDENQTIQSTLNAQYHFYQKMRLELTPWIDALRRMDEKLQQILSVLEITAKRRHGQYQKWYDDAQQDTVDELHNQGILEGMIGAIIAPSNSSDGIVGATRVDEFGRDIGNAAELSRSERWDKRRKKFLVLRRKTIEEKCEIGDENCTKSSESCTAVVDNCDRLINIARSIGQSTCVDLSLSGRRVEQACLYLLRRACQIVQEELDESQLELKSLIDMFHQWFKLHPHDYAQCMASHTLVKFLDILLQLGVVEKVWLPLAMDELDAPREMEVSTNKKHHGANGSSFAETLDDISLYKAIMEKRSSSDKTSGEDSTERWADDILSLIDRQSFLPLLTSMIQRIYDPLSARSSSMARNALKLVKQVKVPPQQAETFQRELFSILRAYVSSIGIPLIDERKSESAFVVSNGSLLDSAADLSFVVVVSQMVRLEVLATNICLYLFPVIRQVDDSYLYYALRSLIFGDILKDRLLPIISSSSSSRITHVERACFSVLSKIHSAIEQCAELQQDSDCGVLTAPLAKAIFHSAMQQQKKL